MGIAHILLHRVSRPSEYTGAGNHVNAAFAADRLHERNVALDPVAGVLDDRTTAASLEELDVPQHRARALAVVETDVILAAVPATSITIDSHEPAWTI